MSYNGSGTFVINSAGQPVAAGTTITATAFNALTADLATGLSTALTKDGQTTATGNIPMGGFKLTGLGTGSAATDGANVGQLQGGLSSFLSVSGTNTITATASPALSAYTIGQVFWFRPAGTNSGAVTINIDGLGAKQLVKGGATPLITGDLISGYAYGIMYNGTSFALLSSTFNVSSIGTLNVSGNATLGSSSANTVTINGTAVNIPNSLNFDSNTLFIDATNNRVGIGTATPAQTLSVAGAAEVTGNVVLGASGANTLTLNGTALSVPNNLNIDTNTFFIDATNDRVGVGTATPAQKLSVAGTIESTSGGVKFPDGTTQTTSAKSVQQVYASSSAAASGATAIPYDNTIPQNTEGTEFITATVTPTSASNVLLIEVCALLTTGGNASVTGALFQDATANAIAATAIYATSGSSTTMTLRYRMTAGTTSATTFKFRAGTNTGATTYFNADSTGTRLFGGVAMSTMTVTELVP